MLKLVIMAIASIMGILWIFLVLRYADSFDRAIERLDGKDYMLKSLLFVGFGFLHMTRFDVKKKLGSKSMEKVVNIYGERMGPYHYQAIRAAQITYLLTLIPAALVFGVLADNWLFLLLGLVAVGIITMNPALNLKGKMERRQDAILMDLPNVESKLTLLIGTGMSLREAWKKTAESSDGVLYREMRMTTAEIRQSGLTEEEAYMNFADRCNQRDIKKLASMIVQNLEKGNAELAGFLKDMSSEAWKNKRSLVIKKGNQATAKLLVPTLLIFIGIIAIVVVPIMTGI